LGCICSDIWSAKSIVEFINLAIPSLTTEIKRERYPELRSTYMSRRKIIVPVVLVVLLVIAAGLIVSLSNRSIRLPNTFDDSPSGFTFRYPEGWAYVIPMQGLMVSAPPETLSQSEAGPTFTIQRIDPISVYGSLDEALDLYLRRGPLRPDRQWRQLGERGRSTFEGREALVVEIQGKENEVSPELRARVVATTAANSFVYLIVLTSPVEAWEAQEATLFAMLESVRLLE
jgi:hypothetical protein